MKKIAKICMWAAALLLFMPQVITAQPDYSNNVENVFMRKTVTQEPDANNNYWITLEAFTTGRIQTVTSTKPCDIVLVLDVSGSMDRQVNVTGYSALSPQTAYTYNTCSKNTYYYFYDDKYYPVVAVQYNETKQYNLYYTTGNNNNKTYYYLDGTSIRQGNNRPTIYSSPSEPIWNAKLYTREFNFSSFSYDYTGTTKISFSYDDVDRGEYYYNDGNNYRRVYASSVTVASNYGLYFTDDDEQRHYLTGTGLSDNAPTDVSNSTTKIYTGVLYQSNSTSKSKINLLKEAVTSFVNSVEDNATDNNHRIAVVKFAGEKRNVVGNDKYNGYNYSQIVNNLTNDYETVKTKVGNLTTGGATRADYGMQHAQTIINNSERDPQNERETVVVMFTDGTPTSSSSFSETVANDAIQAALDLKAKGVKVFTVGIFDEETNNIRNYMNGVSSNYPNAKAYNNLGTGGEGNYYQLSNGADLSSIFQSIAQEIGEAGSQLASTSTVVVDIMSSNFVLPSFVKNDLSRVEVYTVAYKGTDDNGKHQFEPKYNPPTYDTYGYLEEKLVPMADAAITVGEDGEGNDKVTVTGFDFATEYCAVDLTTDMPRGHKLVIKFPIENSAENPGGPDLQTNTSGSGIYLKNSDEPIAEFTVPDLTLPNIIIVAKGLQNIGESATYTIYQLKTTRIYDGKGGYKFETDADGKYNDAISNINYDSEPITVTLTKTSSDAPQVKIKLNAEGRYLVTESSWANGYTAAAQGVYGKDDDNKSDKDDGKTPGVEGNKVTKTTVVSDDKLTLTRTICLGTQSMSGENEFYPLSGNGTLYIFNHTQVTNRTMAKYDEATVKNVFGDDSKVVPTNRNTEPEGYEEPFGEE